QDHVLEDQVRELLARELDGGARVGRRVDAVARLLERERVQLARARVVLDEEDARPGHGWLSTFSCCGRTGRRALPSRNAWIWPANVRVSIGLVMYPSQPAARAFSSSP